MKKIAIGLLVLVIPIIALAGEGGDRTCDQCIDIDDSIIPTLDWQVVAGSTAGEPNGEYTYLFCAIAGEMYTFSTCDAPDSGGGSANYDTALSVWDIAGSACGVNLACNDDNCSGGTSGLLSTISFTAAADGEYLVVVDGFSSGEGIYVLAYTGAPCDVVSSEESSWSDVKGVYR